ncbi:alanine--tRNA ligase [Halanaerobium sp.]|jgi:alanyl-tRNA synthetase|uniref:alanine--tRNA ligase n=1 Tax=Halanaerobium sp. TaxID=1895664 RepID=UPI000DE73C53|nr:alanine--tRNA ligase [Halanaerobium sp.]PUU95013.1 MAG: alaS [Halanaerobium sp.]
MKDYSVSSIRNKYIDFFKEKGHLHLHSFPLIPKNDDSLLLINAGMAPLKKYFTGSETPPSPRVVTCQKCLRTGDIDNVGITSRHCTFFEMLGNFSFGDYFKKEAITWGWEFMTEVMEIDKDKLWVSVYHEDDEAYDIWAEEVRVPKEKIVKLGKEDNFWELEVGPSGPCSEIYYDRGKKYGCGLDDCKPGCDCDRYVEVWNLVFTQYDKDNEGNYNPLPNPNIDTGLGLERMAVVLQDKENVFEVEPFFSLIKELEKLSGQKYNAQNDLDISFRIVSDHIRAVTFLIADGVMPSNEGRGYVLRRLLRRASRHCKLLGIKGNKLKELSKLTVKLWNEPYPELEEAKDNIYKTVEIEEEKFQQTINQGLNILSEYINKAVEKGEDRISGEITFKLYDTYGFPYELTEEILKEKNLSTDRIEFDKLMEQQKEEARKARTSQKGSIWDSSNLMVRDIKATEFKGYHQDSITSKITALFDENGHRVDQLKYKGYLVTEETVFYPEGGGQIGDKGTLELNNSKSEIIDTIKKSNVILHLVDGIKDTLKVGEEVELKINTKLRRRAEANHTSTHILHKVLREELGDHVKQNGSYVDDKRLRFDFTHFNAISPNAIKNIESRVNEIVFSSKEVKEHFMTLKEAKNQDIVALFDSKYSDDVRVIEVDDFSKELCGGTHVDNTSKIGLFKIIGESSVASGVRRIEAITSDKALEYLNEKEDYLQEISVELKTKEDNILDRIKSLNEELKEKEKEIEKYKNELIKDNFSQYLENYQEVKGTKLFTIKFKDTDNDTLRNITDRIKDKESSAVILLAAHNGDKVIFVAGVSKDNISKGIKAGDLVREAAKITGGGGGGRPDFAQAGGKKPEKIDEAFKKVYDILKG